MCACPPAARQQGLVRHGRPAQLGVARGRVSWSLACQLAGCIGRGCGSAASVQQHPAGLAVHDEGALQLPPTMQRPLGQLRHLGPAQQHASSNVVESYQLAGVDVSSSVAPALMACIVKLLTAFWGRRKKLPLVLVLGCWHLCRCFSRPASWSVPRFICFRSPDTHHVGPEVPFLVIGLNQFAL